MAHTTEPAERAPGALGPEELRRKYRVERDKRLRPEGKAQYLDVTGNLERFAADPYLEPAERDPRVADVDTLILGGGWSGLQMAVNLQEAGAQDFLIIDQAGDFGGVWYWNRYPGIRCDVESYIYMPLLEEVGTVPAERYATGAEMFEHARAIGRHYDLYPRALLGTVVTSARWDDDRSRWVIRSDRKDVISARFIVLGTGPLHRPKLPGIPGIDTFGGRSFHSSRWDYSYTGGDANGNLDKLGDKRVALIGTGASSIQILPHLANSAEHVHLFQRTPAIVDVRNNTPTDTEWLKHLEPGWQQRRMDNFVEVTSFRPVADQVNDAGTDVRRRIAALNPGGRPDPQVMLLVDFQKMQEIRARVAAVVKDPQTAKSLQPWYGYFCKRPLYSDEYLLAFNNDNVTLVDTDGRGIDRVTERGIEFDGVEYEVDLIVYGTGFDAVAPTYKAGGYELVGRGGVSLEDHWRDGMHSLHGIMTSRFPNMFLLGGVEQAAISINLPHVASHQAKHIAALVSQFLDDTVAAAEVTPDGEQRWANEMTRAHVDNSRYDSECTPSYYNNEGKLDDPRPTLLGGQYGGGPIGYIAVLQEWSDTAVTRDLSLISV